jgi:hypothetical protein
VLTGSRADDPQPPIASLVFGYGPMLPLVVAAAAAWAPIGWVSLLAVRLAIVWAALILAFVAGVRRGFGMGVDRASTPVELATAITYFTLAGLALIVPLAANALALLVVGYVLVAWADTRAARRGDAPRHFARLRATQMPIGAAALAAMWARLVIG